RSRVIRAIAQRRERLALPPRIALTVLRVDVDEAAWKRGRVRIIERVQSIRGGTAGPKGQAPLVSQTRDAGVEPDAPSVGRRRRPSLGHVHDGDSSNEKRKDASTLAQAQLQIPGASTGERRIFGSDGSEVRRRGVRGPSLSPRRHIV